MPESAISLLNSGDLPTGYLVTYIPDYEIAAPVEPRGSFLIRGPSALHLRFSNSPA